MFLLLEDGSMIELESALGTFLLENDTPSNSLISILYNFSGGFGFSTTDYGFI